MGDFGQSLTKDLIGIALWGTLAFFAVVMFLEGAYIGIRSRRRPELDPPEFKISRRAMILWCGFQLFFVGIGVAAERYWNTPDAPGLGAFALVGLILGSFMTYCVVRTIDFVGFVRRLVARSGRHRDEIGALGERPYQRIERGARHELVAHVTAPQRRHPQPPQPPRDRRQYHRQ